MKTMTVLEKNKAVQSCTHEIFEEMMGDRVALKGALEEMIRDPQKQDHLAFGLAVFFNNMETIESAGRQGDALDIKGMLADEARRLQSLLAPLMTLRLQAMAVECAMERFEASDVGE